MLERIRNVYTERFLMRLVVLVQPSVGWRCIFLLPVKKVLAAACRTDVAGGPQR